VKTSERLDKIADALQHPRAELRRLAIDLPNGRTIELVEFMAVRLRVAIGLLTEEARQLRRFNE
jgi:hypothetical protein